jgi:hypothetical protein
MTTARRRVIQLAFGLVLILVLAEATLQIIHAFDDKLAGTQLGRINTFLESGLSWERNFLDTYKPGALVYGGIHVPHQTLGWSMVPGVRMKRGGATYTVNREGFRSLHDFANLPDRYQVLIVGDSFTFGDSLDDKDTWPYLLEQRDPRLNVLNMAGTGYGIDQMYLTLQESIGQYRPQLVIAAFISDDLGRSLLTFRDFKKPRFVLRNNELVLTNTPIGTPEEVYREAQAKADHLSPIQLVNLARAFRWRMTEAKSPCDPNGECTQLNTRLFEEMSRASAARGAQFMMAYLPYGRELTDARFTRDGEGFLETYRRGHHDLFFDPRAAFLAATIPKSRAHYARPETDFLAGQVYAEIQSLPSWKAFVSQASGR